MMFTPCWPSAGPTGGAGVALPAGICSLTIATIFFAMPRLLQLFHLPEVELDRCLAPEDRHEHADLLFFHHDLVNQPREVNDGPRRDPDRGALLIGDAVFGRLVAQLPQQRPNLFVLQRNRPRAGADKPRHARGVADDVPGVVLQLTLLVHFDLDEHIAGEDLPVDFTALAALDLLFLLGGDQDLEDLVFHDHRGDAALEVRLDLRLIARVGVDRSE